VLQKNSRPAKEEAGRLPFLHFSYGAQNPAAEVTGYLALVLLKV
jgi:hypothetical protein